MAAIDGAVDTCFKSADYIEGRRAFMEKRQPVFQGQVARSSHSCASARAWLMNCHPLLDNAPGGVGLS